jgi:hypothetical protein
MKRFGLHKAASSRRVSIAESAEESAVVGSTATHAKTGRVGPRAA